MRKLCDYEIETLRQVRDGKFHASGFNAAPIQAYEVLVHNGFVSVNAEITDKGRALLDDIDHIEVIEQSDVEPEKIEWFTIAVTLLGILAAMIVLGSVWPS